MRSMILCSILCSFSRICCLWLALDGAVGASGGFSKRDSRGGRLSIGAFRSKPSFRLPNMAQGKNVSIRCRDYENENGERNSVNFLHAMIDEKEVCSEDGIV